MKTKLKELIKNSGLSSTEIKKKIMKVLMVTNDITKILRMSQEVMAFEFRALKINEIENLINEFGGNIEPTSKNNVSNQTSQVNSVKQIILAAQNRINQLQSVDFTNNVYVIKDNDVIVIPINLFREVETK